MRSIDLKHDNIWADVRVWVVASERAISLAMFDFILLVCTEILFANCRLIRCFCHKIAAGWDLHEHRSLISYILQVIIDPIAQNQKTNSVQSQGNCILHPHRWTKLFTHLLYWWVFCKAWDQRSTGRCHERGREAGRCPWRSAAVPV